MSSSGDWGTECSKATRFMLEWREQDRDTEWPAPLETVFDWIREFEAAYLDTNYNGAGYADRAAIFAWCEQQAKCDVL